MLSKDAIDTSAYIKQIIQKHVTEFTYTEPSMQTPLSSFITIQNIFASGKYSEYQKYAAASIQDIVKDMKDKEVNSIQTDNILSANIIATLVFGDFAAILSKGSADYYSLWYFLKENDHWKCRGEDIGGDSAKDAEITFREKAPAFIPLIK